MSSSSSTAVLANAGDGKPPWSGWKKTENVPTESLEDVMSQELAAKLQQEENDDLKLHIKQAIKRTSVRDSGAADAGTSSGAYAESCYEDVDHVLLEENCSTSNDLLMAQMLQMEFDKEADAALQRSQDHYNAGSKISVSFEKYRNIHPLQQEEVYSDPEEAEELRICEPNMNFGKRGIRGSGKNIVTKHDTKLAAQKNADTAMDKFSLDVATGDGDKYEMRLSNKVFNKLKVHSIAERKRAARLHEKKDQSTATQAVDQKTRLQLFKMLNNGLLEEVHGVISVGKESAVLHATGGEVQDCRGNFLPIPDEVALKVFKTTLSEFKNREKYVRGDFRLANEFKKQNPRKIMSMWAEKEMLNLKRMKKFGITCPEVIKLKKHILVMQFIGKDQVPAPKLKDAKLSGDNLQSAYHQVVDGVINLYKKCSLVHADLSEYNLLWHEGHVYFIDVSQAVDLSHPLAHEFLLRDCHRVHHFFTKNGMDDVPSAYALFNMITGMNLNEKMKCDEEFLQQIQEYEKEQVQYQLDEQRKEFAFDHMFELNQVSESESSEEEDADCNQQCSEESSII